jgi:hypothetical protein
VTTDVSPMSHLARILESIQGLQRPLKYQHEYPLTYPCRAEIRVGIHGVADTSMNTRSIHAAMDTLVDISMDTRSIHESEEYPHGMDIFWNTPSGYASGWCSGFCFLVAEPAATAAARFARRASKMPTLEY